MVSFLAALQFLTIIPLKIKHIEERQISESMIYFPLVGLLLGLILAASDKLLYFLNFNELATNTILVVLLIVLTGGMHLDGLADTADAFLSRKNKEEMLRIMRDSHIGAMGVLMLVSIMLLKISFLSALTAPLKTGALVLMCVLSRWAMVISMFLFPYARTEGKAKIFIQGANLRIVILAGAITLLCVFALWRLQGALVAVLITLITCITGKFISNKIGGITGDTLGATNEIIEITTLFIIIIMEGTNLCVM
jgi:adenosylcobinamide-GDP ribazoletransferase